MDAIFIAFVIAGVFLLLAWCEWLIHKFKEKK